MSRTVWWIRHGPTHAKAMVGWTDIAADLSDHAAIERLQTFLPRSAVVTSSDLVRATGTAAAIAADRARARPVPSLREMNFGEWENRTIADIEAQDPDRIFAFWDQPGDISAPKGESWNDLRARVDGAVSTLLAEIDAKDLIIVAHLGVILTQVQRARNVPARTAFSQKIDNLSVTAVRTDPSGRIEMPLVNHRP